MNSKGFNRAMVACLWIVLAFMYIPIIAIIGMSFNATPYGMFPYVFTFDWYKILFTESNLLPACVFSLKFAFGVTVAAIIIGTMASFGLQAYSPKWSNRLNALIQLPIIIPWLVTAISLLLLFSFIGAGRSMVSMFFGNLIVVLPYVVLLVNGRFVSMDRTPESAARLLGAGPVRVFFDITLPAIVPGDFLVIHDTGAHGFSMGYNYNGKLKSAEILLHPDGTFSLIRRAETVKDYFATFDFCDILENANLD